MTAGKSLNLRDKSASVDADFDYIWCFADIEFDEPQWQLRVGGVPVDVEVRPLEVLACLLRHAGEVVTKEELFQAAWPGVIVEEAAQAQAVARLRKALGDSNATRIVTVHRVGYRLDGDVRRTQLQRAPQPKLDLKPGESIPRREHWKLKELLNVNPGSEVWRVQHIKTHENRCFKFATDPRQLSALKREVTLSRVLTLTLGERPDIVRVLDWNFTVPPFFIECQYGGPDLNRWTGFASVSLPDRMKLFVGIAEAVAAAHSAGVLHKDLKPSNVLISESSGGRPVPQLTDFGSAKLLDPDVLSALDVTRIGFTQTLAGDSRSGTLFYLAPELLKGQAPTVQSDVYALGVMLYQLAVGDLHRPLVAGWEADVPDELLREDIALAANGNPERRPSSVQQLAALVRDLEQRRADRRARLQEQQTAQQARILAEERAREAQLALERVHARRWWVRATLAALSAGVVSAGVLYWQARQSQQQAQDSALIAQGINRFLTEKVLGGADPRRAPVRDLTVRKLFDNAAASIPEDVEANPAIAARIHHAFGTTYSQMGLHKSAVGHLERAVNLYRELHGGSSPEVATASASLVTALLYTGEHEKLCKVADWLVQFHQSHANSGSALLNARFSRAMCLRFQNKTQDAVAEYRAILAELHRLQPEDSELKLRTLQNLGVTQYEGGEPGAAEQTLARALAYSERVYGARHVLTAKVRWRRGRALHNAGRLKDAEQEYLVGQRDLDAWFGPDSAEAVTIESFLGEIYYLQGRHREAEAAALALLPRIATSADFSASGKVALLNLLARLRERQGRCDEVAELAEQSVALQAADNYPISWFGAGAKVPWIACLRRQHRLAEARAELDGLSLAIAAKVGNPLPSEGSALDAVLGEANGLLLLEEGKPAEAMVVLSRALDALRSRPDTQEWQLRELAGDLEMARRAANRQVSSRP